MTYSRTEVLRRGTGAARRLRASLRSQGHVECSRCKFVYLASALDVDHITPLSKGGEDVDDNVWALCRTCHKVKTIDDMGYDTVPF